MSCEFMSCELMSCELLSCELMSWNRNYFLFINEVLINIIISLDLFSFYGVI